MKIRTETAADLEAIHRVNAAAFPSDAEARLVDQLREQVASLISLVAEERGDVVGHILFSPLTVAGAELDPGWLALGPMAVAPACQRRGIGSALVREGLERCRAASVPAVVVLGHPEFYPRFGFQSAARFGIGSEYDVPSEVFMIRELASGALEGVTGIVRYHEAFRGV